MFPNPENCKVPEFVDCVMKKGQNSSIFSLPRGMGRKNMFTDTCATETGCTIAAMDSEKTFQDSFGKLLRSEREFKRSVRMFAFDWYNSMDKFVLKNFSRLIE